MMWTYLYSRLGLTEVLSPNRRLVQVGGADKYDEKLE